MISAFERIGMRPIHTKDADPTPLDDGIGSGGNGVFQPDELWRNQSSRAVFLCIENTTENAVWKTLSPGLSVQTELVDGGTISVGADHHHEIKVSGAAGPAVNVFLEDGKFEGQEIRIQGIDDASAVRFSSEAAVFRNGLALRLCEGDWSRMLWDAGEGIWNEIERNVKRRVNLMVRHGGGKVYHSSWQRAAFNQKIWDGGGHWSTEDFQLTATHACRLAIEFYVYISKTEKIALPAAAITPINAGGADADSFEIEDEGNVQHLFKDGQSFTQDGSTYTCRGDATFSDPVTHVPVHEDLTGMESGDIQMDQTSGYGGFLLLKNGSDIVGEVKNYYSATNNYLPLAGSIAVELAPGDTLTFQQRQSYDRGTCLGLRGGVYDHSILHIHQLCD